MKTIWKVEVDVAQDVPIRVPKGARILTLHVQHDRPCIWFLCDPKAEMVERKIFWYGNGHPVPDRPGEYLGTILLHNGTLVFHAFEVRT